VSASVRRKLDFSNDNLDGNILESSAISGSPHKRVNSTRNTASAKLTNGTKLAPQKRPYTEDDGDDSQDESAQTEEDGAFDNGGDSFQMVNGGDDGDDAEPEEPEETLEPEPESEPKPSKKSKGKAKAVEPEAVEVPAKGKRGRRPKNPNPPQAEEENDEPPAKRARRSLEGPVAVPEPTSKSKPGRLSKPGPAGKYPKLTVPAPKETKSKAAPKATGKQPKLAPIAQAESPEAQRGPPLPRNSRGLMILRRETPGVGASFKQTRSGRNSIKPVAYWKNEKVEYSEDEMEDTHGKFLTTRIKGVVRVDEVEEKQKKSYYKPSKGKKRAAAAESDNEETEPWEDEPGRIIAPYRLWDPEDPTGIQQPEEEAELALSSAAIITRDIAGATFQFAKTLTLPFFGSGMVDLPAWTEKKMKNSRRMQMVFFVYYGRVEVTVNDTTFGIGKGGMWQVPRGICLKSLPSSYVLTFLGNSYSIVNDYDKPARIFFAQGCEVLEELEEGQ
jgi:centromere protein C